MTRGRVTSLILCMSLVACTSGAPTQSADAPAGTSAPSGTSAPPVSSATTVVLHEAPANLGCDAIGIDYTSMTFHIDPAAAEQVSAETDTGVTLVTYWAAGFEPGSDTERLVRDPAGKTVVTDGDVLQVPPAAYPRLGGYFVCLAPDKLYVLLADPS
jgi:hypothetical protein